MIPFAEEIFSIEFKEKPNYSKLRFLLERNLLESNEVPNKVYDWNENVQRIKKCNQVSRQISDESYTITSGNLDELQVVYKQQIKSSS